MSSQKVSQHFGVQIISFVNNKRRVVALYVALVVIGGSVYSWAEGKSFWDGAWWAVISSLSIGYGDQYPTTVIGRIDGIIVGVVGIMIIVPIIIGLIIQDILQDLHKFTHCEQEILLARTKIIHEASKLIIENQHVINHNVGLLGDMLVKIGKASNVDLTSERAMFMELVVSDEYETLKPHLYALEDQLVQERSS